MSLLSGVSDFFGLDIGTTAIRLVQLKNNGSSKALVKFAYVPVNSQIVMSDSPADKTRLAHIIKDLVEQSRVSTMNVVAGLPSQKIFTTVVDIDRLPSSELNRAIHLQADSLIPTSVDESKIDWALTGDSPTDKTKMEILLTSVTNSFIEQRLDLLESIGLNVVAFEPDSLALARSLLARDATQPELIFDLGNKSSDLLISMNGVPRLVRSIATGTEAIVRSAAQNLNIDDKQAQQFVFKFGLTREKLEGQVYNALLNTVELLSSEIEKSIKFFQARYTSSKVDKIIVTGSAAAIPGFPVYVANKFELNVEIGNAWRNVSYSPERQNDLLSLSSQFGVVVGLAERTE